MIRSQRIPSILTKSSLDLLASSWEAYASGLKKSPEIPPRPFDVLYDISKVENIKQIHDSIIQVYSKAENFINSFSVDVIPVIPVCETHETGKEDLERLNSTYVPPKNADLIALLRRKEYNYSVPLRSGRHPISEAIYAGRLSAPFCQFDHVAVGGTFDRLHSGHKLLLTISGLFSSECLNVGITSDNMVKSKQYSRLIETNAIRQRGVLHFLKKIRPDLTVSIRSIEDPSGGIHIIPWLKALCLSSETLENGKKINALREENGLNQLQLICVQLVKGPSGKGKRISSTSRRSKSM